VPHISMRDSYQLLFSAAQVADAMNFKTRVTIHSSRLRH
jgi:hypothetical protein